VQTLRDEEKPQEKADIIVDNHKTAVDKTEKDQSPRSGSIVKPKNDKTKPSLNSDQAKASCCYMF
jgi:hypothetical protein